MTTNLTDEEYDKYFNEIILDGNGELREIEFEGQILMVTPHEKWNTRCELLLATGDYTDGNFTGPYIKTRDIQPTFIYEILQKNNILLCRKEIEAGKKKRKGKRGN